jgi:hypothetical protein
MRRAIFCEENKAASESNVDDDDATVMMMTKRYNKPAISGCKYKCKIVARMLQMF